MPSTITAYYTFSPATKARSSQVNDNFSNHRGDLIAINADTASASDLVHNLGSPTHRWLTGYMKNIRMAGATSTTDLEIAQTALTAGAVNWFFNSVTAATLYTTGWKGLAAGAVNTYTQFGAGVISTSTIFGTDAITQDKIKRGYTQDTNVICGKAVGSGGSAPATIGSADVYGGRAVLIHMVSATINVAGQTSTLELQRRQAGTQTTIRVWSSTSMPVWSQSSPGLIFDQSCPAGETHYTFQWIGAAALSGPTTITASVIVSEE